MSPSTQTTPDTRAEVGVVVPCYNAGPRLRPVIEHSLNIVRRVIVVDDGSTDDSASSIEGLDVPVVAFPDNRGKGHAILEGFRAALEAPEIRAVAVVDADGQHDPAEIPQLYGEFVRNDADLVIGSRAFELEHVPWRNRFGNRLTIALTALLLGQRIPDTQSGYRLHSRRLVEDVIATVPGGRYETEMEILVKAVREGYKVLPVPIQTIYEEGNPSSHFNRLRDSYLIYRRLFTASLRRRRTP